MKTTTTAPQSGARSATPATCNKYKIVSHHVLYSHMLCHMLPHQKVQTYVTSKITTSTDVEFEYLEVEYIARCRLLANLAFSKCSAWSVGFE
jgi:hypothetical protein